MAAAMCASPWQLEGHVTGQFEDASDNEVEERVAKPGKIAPQDKRAAAAMFFHGRNEDAERHGDRGEVADGFSDDDEGSDGDSGLADLERSLLREGCTAAAAAAGASGGVGAMRSQLEAKIDTSLRAAHSVQNDIRRSERTSERTPRHTGRDDRATSEQVLDPRTRLILFKLLNHGVLARIDGCLSTGKEANVYFAVGADGATELAVKIYKTSILVFRDRDKYVSGEYRHRRGYCRSNPRKMVKVWAEKEMRNLRRLSAAGIPSPAPLLVKNNVLVMAFLGTGGWPAPRLRDAQIGPRRMQSAYAQCVCHMRAMYHRCRLVHGDLSEYNLLFHEGRVVVIDVSQSMEHDHPRAMDFLRVDCRNVTDFFRRQGCVMLSARALFAFVVDADLPCGVAAEGVPAAGAAAAAGPGVPAAVVAAPTAGLMASALTAVEVDGAKAVEATARRTAEETGTGVEVAQSSSEDGRMPNQEASIAGGAAGGSSHLADDGMGAMHPQERQRFEALLAAAADEGEAPQRPGDSVDDAVFMSSFIPRSLYEVEDFEAKHAAMRANPGATAGAAAVSQMLLPPRRDAGEEEERRPPGAAAAAAAVTTTTAAAPASIARRVSAATAMAESAEAAAVSADQPQQAPAVEKGASAATAAVPGVAIAEAGTNDFASGLCPAAVAAVSEEDAAARAIGSAAIERASNDSGAKGGGVGDGGGSSSVEEDSSSEYSDDDDDDSDSGGPRWEKPEPPTEAELQKAREDRKAAKKAVKEERREKRKSKIPKHIKKQKIKSSRRGKK